MDLNDPTQLKDYFDTIHSLATELVEYDYIFQEVKKLIQDNENLRESKSSFWTWMQVSYATYTSVRIRMLADRDSRSKSLINLLVELCEPNNRSLLTRSHYKSLFRNLIGADEIRRQAPLEQAFPINAFPESLADKYFDDFAGQGMEEIDPLIIQMDLCKIVKVCRPVKHFVNKRVAHFDHGDFKDLVKYSEIHQCIETIEKLVIKYQKLLFASSTDRLLPIWLYDWKSIFRTPWIPQGPGAQFDQEKHEN